MLGLSISSNLIGSAWIQISVQRGAFQDFVLLETSEKIIRCVMYLSYRISRLSDDHRFGLSSMRSVPEQGMDTVLYLPGQQMTGVFLLFSSARNPKVVA